MVAQTQSFLFERLEACVTRKGNLCVDRGDVSMRISSQEESNPAESLVQRSTSMKMLPGPCPNGPRLDLCMHSICSTCASHMP